MSSFVDSGIILVKLKPAGGGGWGVKLPLSQIRVKLVIELKQNWDMLYMSHVRCNKSNMTLMQQTSNEKLVILKINSFHTTNISYKHIFSLKVARSFIVCQTRT